MEPVSVFIAMKTNIFAKDKALQKMKAFCSIQERCPLEVREKLHTFFAGKEDADGMLSQLIAENYVNEERFAIQFAGGKFRIKQWGKNKIRHALKQKQVSDPAIKKALLQIDGADYQKTLHKLAKQKLASLTREKNFLYKKKKLRDHLLQKGYEHTLIKQVTDEIAV